MPSLLESLTYVLTPTVTKSLRETTGLGSSVLSQGLGVVGPLSFAAMARRASTPSGLDALSRLIPHDWGAGLGNLAGMFAAGGATPSTLGGLFGSGLGAVSGTLDRKLGFTASSLIGMVAPVALGLVSRRRSTEGLDLSNVVRLLQEEQEAFLTNGGETASLVRSALDAGDRASEIKGKFAAEEWASIRAAPAAAARLVLLASPSGLLGAVKEAAAAAKAIAQVRAPADPTSLVGLAFDSEITRAERATIGTCRAANLAVIKSAIDAVAAHFPAETLGFAKFVRTVARRVAEGIKEAGFLGIGGTRISKGEEAAIVEIDALAGASA
jgi:hypothetical protein